MAEYPHSGSGGRRGPRVDIYWTNVTYKTVAIYLIIAFVLLLGVLYLIAPDWVTARVSSFTNAVSGGADSGKGLAANQVRFVNLDGKVQVKKVNSVSWVNADYRMPIDKGDLIQTGSDGVARIAFSEGTTYVIKPDSFVTVEENLTGRNKPTIVGLDIHSGALDLSTGNLQDPASSAKVKFEDAEAVVRGNSRASVRSDPAGNQHEMTVAQGSAEVIRANDRVTLSQWERASFHKGGPTFVTSVLAPPELISPINLQTFIVAAPKKAAVRLQWKPVPNTSKYIVRVSPSSKFTNVLLDRPTTSSSLELTGLNAGDYFWSVTAVDSNNQSSEPSEPSKFTLAAKGAGQDMLLEVDETRLHGNVVEVIGRTEPGAALIINGQAVASIQPDGKFRHFTQPLSPGVQSIVITGQNRRGGTATKPVNIVIPRP